MGSFSMTCSISGLGISAGTPVRVLLLTESPYGEGWSVRTPPLRAEYNDYGSIENVHKDDQYITDLWLRGFQEDLVEVGTGDNEVHDVPTRKKMTFEELLDALQEGRVFVRQDTEHFWRRPRDFHFPKSDEDRERDLLTPSLQKVEALLEGDEALRKELGGKVVGSGIFCGKFLLDSPRPNVVRIRWSRSASGDGNKKYVFEDETRGEIQQLEKAKSIVETAGFVGCIIASTYCQRGSTELVVFAPPSHLLFHAGPKWYAGKKETPDGKDAPLRVAMAMVREDVWQAMCQFPHSDMVDKECLNCGISISYHNKDVGKGRPCPAKNPDPGHNRLGTFKKHPKGSVYRRGRVYPASIKHVIQKGTGDFPHDTVWYGLDVYKNNTRETWASIVEHFREKTPSELKALNRRHDLVSIRDMMAAFRMKEKDRLAKLTPAERRKEKAEQKERIAKREAEYQEMEDHPVFGDFLTDDGNVPDAQRPGAWIFRDHVPGVISVANHLSMLLADRKPVPEDLLDRIAELSIVTHALHEARKRWKPATSVGSQFPEWDLHLRHLKMLIQIAESEIAESNAKRFDEEETPMECAPMTLDEVKAR